MKYKKYCFCKIYKDRYNILGVFGCIKVENLEILYRKLR